MKQRKLITLMTLLIVLVVSNVQVFALPAKSEMTLYPVEAVEKALDIKQVTPVEKNIVRFILDDYTIAFNTKTGENFLNDKLIEGYEKPKSNDGCDYISYELVMDVLSNNIPLTYFGTEGEAVEILYKKHSFEGEWRLTNKVTLMHFYDGIIPEGNFYNREMAFNHNSNKTMIREKFDERGDFSEWKDIDSHLDILMNISENKIENKNQSINPSKSRHYDYSLTHSGDIRFILNEEQTTEDIDDIDRIDKDFKIVYESEDSLCLETTLNIEDFKGTDYEGVFKKLYIKDTFSRVSNPGKLPAKADSKGHIRVDYLKENNGDLLVPLKLAAKVFNSSVKVNSDLDWVKVNREDTEIIFEMSQGRNVVNGVELNEYAEPKMSSGLLFVSSKLFMDILGDQEALNELEARFETSPLQSKLLGEWQLEDSFLEVIRVNESNPLQDDVLWLSMKMDNKNMQTVGRSKSPDDSDYGKWRSLNMFMGSDDAYGYMKVIKSKYYSKNLKNLEYDYVVRGMDTIDIKLNEGRTQADTSKLNQVDLLDKAMLTKTIQFTTNNKFVVTTDYTGLDLKDLGINEPAKKLVTIETFVRVK